MGRHLSRPQELPVRGVVSCAFKLQLERVDIPRCHGAFRSEYNIYAPELVFREEGPLRDIALCSARDLGDTRHLLDDE